MKEESGIVWTDYTLNPWIGCTRVSPACLNCYAATFGKRFGIEWGKGKPRKETAKWRTLARSINEKTARCMKCGRWCSPSTINKHVQTCCRDSKFMIPRKPSVFCGSLMDIFDQEVDPTWRNELFKIVAECTGIFWLLLTKRIVDASKFVRGLPDWPWDHVALGTTAENQDCWDRRVPILLNAHAKVSFVSVEPMLGPINPRGFMPDWVIIGGESGAGARSTDTEWIRSFKNQLMQIEPRPRIMIKQLGARPTCTDLKKQDIRYFDQMRDSHGANPNEWPPDLRFQEIIKQLHDDHFAVFDLQRESA